ncbi:MAG: branched-chain amino acid transaminase [Candidatus Margulisbacteria bacterium]|nr:branched-chain amino acid transaminase [Candidatus Margulisiibacteriota bacterium]MBU1022558.1 branched-chain amino acid transaminase [Candidatus Margulisiibacteriota bacterium]MBU1728844.1 branched-chain amino acid transaminase [Candidatus Margulisiibacteriota bacterium]MBU1955475.1 branched-chain amino acid transaminase [Candidatus Margulisiibacteriota bacterium]
MKYAFFKGKIVPFADAKISVMTHAFNYGTGVFEGIRGYWNKEKSQMFLVKLAEHYERLFRSARVLHIDIKYSIDELCKMTVDLVNKNGYKEDVYVRPIAYKSQEKIGLGLIGIEDDLCIYLAPFGNYLDISKGIKVCTSTWRRIDDLAIPARAKVTGLYVNSSLAKAEAIQNGCAEAIMLSGDGHVLEGSGENIFIVRDGKVFTPPVHENILEGITRKALIEMIQDELKVVVVERSIDRSELYIADEIFFCGTGAQVSPVSEVDHRKVGNGKVGKITKKIQEVYFKAARGDDPAYQDWLTPVY